MVAVLRRQQGLPPGGGEGASDVKRHGRGGGVGCGRGLPKMQGAFFDGVRL